LGEIELAQSFHTSRTPVREALRRLHAEGLVTLTPRRGAVVNGTSLREIVDAYEVREILEPFGALRAAERGLNPRILNSLRRRLARLSDAEPLSSADVNERESVDRALHSAIAEASGNDALARVIEEMHSRVLRALGLIGRGGRFGTSRAEHLEILKAIQGRNGEQARVLMSQHLRLSKEWLLGHGILKGSGPVDYDYGRLR
jgi:DNA-binding GntR family transcriptional regulator